MSNQISIEALFQKFPEFDSTWEPEIQKTWWKIFDGFTAAAFLSSSGQMTEIGSKGILARIREFQEKKRGPRGHYRPRKKSEVVERTADGGPKTGAKTGDTGIRKYTKRSGYWKNPIRSKQKYITAESNSDKNKSNALKEFDDEFQGFINRLDPISAKVVVWSHWGHTDHWIAQKVDRPVADIEKIRKAAYLLR